MSGRDSHVPADRLTALALLARAPDSSQDEDALAHVAVCDACADSLARFTAEADGLRDAAFAEADAIFDDVRVEAQRSRILDRLAQVGHAARVLRFPARSREAAMPIPTGSRRWVSVAAAAGLIIGLLAGQLVHLVPWDIRLDGAPAVSSIQSAVRQSPVIVPASNGGRALSDDELLDEIEAAVQVRRAHSLRALDELTPTATDLSLGR
jgi:hypothetical protein